MIMVMIMVILPVGTVEKHQENIGGSPHLVLETITATLKPIVITIEATLLINGHGAFVHMH